MRHRTFRQFLASGEGEKTGSAEFEAEVEHDADLARELHEEVLLPWLAKHQESNDSLLPALLHAAALHAMAGEGMTPDDFAEFAREVAKSASGMAAEILRKYKGRGRG